MSLRSYLSGQPAEESQSSMLACFLVYYAVATPGQLAAGGLEGKAEISVVSVWLYVINGLAFLPHI